MAPRKYWRVQDEHSQSRYDERWGMLAGDPHSSIDFNPRGWEEEDVFINELENHLDWGNREPTVFISVYTDEDRAYEEAERRMERGRQQVVVHEIVPLRDHSMEYRSVRGLAEWWGVEIPEEAYRNSEYEYVFLHQIVPEAVVRTHPS